MRTTTADGILTCRRNAGDGIWRTCCVPAATVADRSDGSDLLARRRCHVGGGRCAGFGCCKVYIGNENDGKKRHRRKGHEIEGHEGNRHENIRHKSIRCGRKRWKEKHIKRKRRQKEKVECEWCNGTFRSKRILLPVFISRTWVRRSGLMFASHGPLHTACCRLACKEMRGGKERCD